MSFMLGLTGSIGMGKSTTAQMFAEEGCAIWDADAAVHRAYGIGGAAVAPVGEVFPEAIIDETVSREILKQIIGRDPEALKRIEAIVHPLLAADRGAFINDPQSDILVFDIPLLFETGGNTAMDAVACVTVPPETQRERVMARGTMTAEQFEAIVAKQMPAEEKCARADYVIDTSTMEGARQQVKRIVAEIRERLEDA